MYVYIHDKAYLYRLVPPLPRDEDNAFSYVHFQSSMPLSFDTPDNFKLKINILQSYIQ
jgi:hypothetical protein